MRRSLGALLLAGAVTACLDGSGPLIVDVIAIQAPATAIRVGDSYQFTLIALDPAGRVVAGYFTDWSSSAPLVATVTTNGIVIGRGEGQTWIKAKVQNAVDSVQVTVSEPIMGERPIGQ